MGSKSFRNYTIIGECVQNAKHMCLIANSLSIALLVNSSIFSVDHHEMKYIYRPVDRITIRNP
ncbi:hypothetical protein Q6332_29775, partial [Klebsiella pneumoniae]|uniref:hypothetical protein n=1 Tax=Klebsiella pneumoniae TaxID=573 RepID=UPI00272F4C9C